MNIKRIYAALLRLYPTDHRRLFATEMLAVFEQAAEKQRVHGPVVFTRFMLAEFIGLITGSCSERIAKLTRNRLSDPIHLTDEVTLAQRDIDFIVSRMEYAIATHQFQKVRLLAEAERRTREKLHFLRGRNQNEA